MTPQELEEMRLKNIAKDREYKRGFSDGLEAGLKVAQAVADGLSTSKADDEYATKLIESAKGGV